LQRLEVSADYTPVVSGYKEGVVLSYEPKSKMVHIRLDSLPPGNPLTIYLLFEVVLYVYARVWFTCSNFTAPTYWGTLF